VAEVGQQLAWLGAALRTSPWKEGVACCTPFIEAQSGSGDQSLPFAIGFRIDSPSAKGNGQCWHGLFRRPVIAQGFPIPQRTKTNTGLETPINMAAALARAKYIDTFNSKLFIKGFSTMLIPVKRSDNIVIWHLLYNGHPNDRISYLDSSSVEHADVTMRELETTRHIIGWCSEAVLTAGRCISLRVGGNGLAAN